MNLLLLGAEEVTADGQVRLEDRRAEHLLRVLGVRVGQTVRAGVEAGAVGEARVTRIDGGAVELELDLAGAPVPRRPTVDLILALPRPQVLHRVLQFSAAMGVGRLDLIRSWRVEKSFFGSPSLRPEKIERQLRLGVEQGVTTHLPEVEIHPRFLDGLESIAARELPGCRLIGHPGARPIERVVGGPFDRAVLAIGPEGGWIDREIETFGALGFRPVALGEWVLRVEAALVAMLAQLDLLRRFHRVGPLPAEKR